jgi:hypothetical protein
MTHHLHPAIRLCFALLIIAVTLTGSASAIVVTGGTTTNIGPGLVPPIYYDRTTLVGISSGDNNNTLVISNTLFRSGSLILSATGSRNNQIFFGGTPDGGQSFVTNTFAIGDGGSSSTLTVSAGAIFRGLSNIVVGNAVTASNNSILANGGSFSADGANGVRSILIIGNNGSFNTATAMNGGLLFATEVVVGNAATASNNRLVAEYVRDIVKSCVSEFSPV